MKTTFILGGARSGKSTYAVDLANKLESGIREPKTAFVATCSYFDEEMKERISLHRKERPEHWETFEEFYDLAALLENIADRFDVVIIDCLTLFISGLLLEDSDEAVITARIEALFQLDNNSCNLIIVSNEVGLGMHPNNRLGRDFRDIAGRINQLVAHKSEEVYFMVAGLPMKIK
ncbi:bifunctional adenosylcobinamide kinase/adenosylcobinamide-phosphate guanylyltransferase [Candidatus Margulisiibacteriota bacterium]